MDPDLTVEQAKADTQRLELEVADAFPAELVERVEQMESGTLLRCGPDREYIWTGRTKVFFNTPVTSDDVLRDLASQFDYAEFATVDGEPEAHVYGPEGQSVLVSYFDDGAYASLESGSACFVLPEDKWSRDVY